MRNKKITSILLLLLSLLVFLSGCQPYETIAEGEQRVYKWRMVTHQMPGTARYEGTIKPFVEAVEEITGGQLVIEPFGRSEERRVGKECRARGSADEWRANGGGDDVG